VQTTAEERLVKFGADERANIVKTIKELTPDSSLTAFSNIFGMIQKATGMLPKDVIPIIQRLGSSYSNTTMLVKVNFADSTAILSKFVVKGYRVMQRGMKNDDIETLKGFVQQLNTSIIDKLNTFVESSRLELMEIWKQLYAKANAGHEITQLFKKRDDLEATLIRQSEEVANISSEYGENNGQIESLRFEKQVFEKAVNDTDAAREDAKNELNNLKAQIPDYENKVLQHHGSVREHRGSFLFWSWHVRNVRFNTGERIARENLNRLVDRIHSLESAVENWPKVDLVDRVMNARYKLAISEEKKESLALKHTEVKAEYAKSQRKFNDAIDELEGIFKTTGTMNSGSFEQVKELCLAVYSGKDCIVAAYMRLRTHASTIGIDKDSMDSSIMNAIQFINMADAYMGTTVIQNIKQLLGLK
ncbi:unnamed protein product, partial [Adineta steineri]